MTVARSNKSPVRAADKLVVHLVDLQHPRSTLCGASLVDAEIGVYVEQLEDTEADREASWTRCIYPLCGGEAEPCANCLARQPPVLSASFIEPVGPVNTTA